MAGDVIPQVAPGLLQVLAIGRPLRDLRLQLPDALPALGHPLPPGPAVVFQCRVGFARELALVPVPGTFVGGVLAGVEAEAGQPLPGEQAFPIGGLPVHAQSHRRAFRSRVTGAQLALRQVKDGRGPASVP